MDRRPIGVFDSGIGGLTVVRALMQRLPHESIVYFGDTARVPWGNKSPETVRRYSREVCDVLLMRGVKMVVVACNTASAHALEELQDTCSMPVLGVIAPGARAAVDAAGKGAIGVIGTTGTIRSGAYERAIRALAPKARVVQAACPLFVPMVEEGWLEGEVPRLVAQRYLEPLRAAGIGALVLGCTHYPLLKPLLASVLGEKITLIDSAEETAWAVDRELKAARLEAPGNREPDRQFMVSDAADTFERLGAAFLGQELRDVQTVVFTERG